MNNESIGKLRLDRRLHRRRDWLSPEELQKELDALPDVSDKILEDEEDDSPAADANAETPAAEVAPPVPGAPILPEGGGA